MVLNVRELHAALHDLFNDTARRHARETGFCLRERELTGPVFAQSLVFCLLENPDSSLDDFADFALRELGVDVTHQAFEERFTSSASLFFLSLFQEAFDRSFSSARPALLPLLRRFNGVFLRDATLIALPDCLAGLFPARDCNGTPTAALKLVLELEVATGRFTEASVLPGLHNEKTAEVSSKPLPEGALLLEDMGFLCGERLQDYIRQGVYFLTRVPHWTAFFAKKEVGRGYERVDVLKWLRGAEGDCVEREIHILHAQKLRVRLLAVRVPEEEAERRRQRVREEAKKRGRAVSREKLDLCEWNVLVTNAPAELLRAYDAWEVRRVRWQIELVFRVFKSEGGIERTRAQNRWRVLAELFAKLLAMVVQQWALLAAGYVMLRHSARRAARRVRKQAPRLLQALASVEALAREVSILAIQLDRRCKIERRHKQPSTFDRLAKLDAEFRLIELTGES